MGKTSNKISEYNTILEDTYILYKYNIDIDYHHIRNKNEERHTKKECQVIKVVNIILHFMTLTAYTYKIRIKIKRDIKKGETE